MNSKSNILVLKEQINNWKSKMKNSDKFVKIFAEHVNQPEK